uniref:Uncharacterized protein n=1 Tax=Glossina palpalis gambiensis TaxID=67801 RepID=A0A1B0C104_9MUSC
MVGKKEKEWYWKKIQETLSKIGPKKTIIQWKKLKWNIWIGLFWVRVCCSLLFNCVVPERLLPRLTLIWAAQDLMRYCAQSVLEVSGSKYASMSEFVAVCEYLPSNRNQQECLIMETTFFKG